MAKPTTKKPAKPREKPLLVYPMKPDELLKIMLKTPPMPKEQKPTKRKNKTK